MIAKYKNKKIKLKGKKVLLSSIKKSHLKYFVKWLKDEEVNKYLINNFKNMTMKKGIEWFNKKRTSRSEILFGVYTIKNKQIIGSIGLRRIDLHNKRANFGITIMNKDYWNMGFGTEATRLLLRFAFDKLKLKSINLLVNEKHFKAQRVYKKVGFRKAGLFRKSRFYKGKYYNNIIMDILDSDFKNAT